MSHEHRAPTPGSRPVTGHPHGPGPGGKRHFFDSPENTRRFFTVFYVICGVLVLAEVLVDRHTEHSWEVLFGFHALWGFASFWFLVLAAKQMRRLLIRAEDYYEAGPRTGPPAGSREGRDVE